MDIKIKKLMPEMADDYVRFFDNTPHDDQIDEHKCYCVCWASDDYEGKDFSTVEKRRNYAKKYIEEGKIQGYLAYNGDQIVGWCNANTKADCLKCVSWRMFMQHVPLDDVKAGLKVKSIFCFMIAPHIQRKGIATLLLEKVCEDAVIDGFDYIEAYPYINNGTLSSPFGGYDEMFKKYGFQLTLDSHQGLVMRKKLR